MIIEKQNDTWVARGAGHLRPIVAEGVTRAEAAKGFIELFKEQHAVWDAQHIRRRPKTCPVCLKVFQGDGYEGLDAHWRHHHEDVMPYEEARRVLLDVIRDR